MTTTEYIHETIRAIVDSIKPIGTITKIQQRSDGRYVVECINSFTKNDVIGISNSNGETFTRLVVFEANGAGFVINENVNYDNQYSYSYKGEDPYFLHEKRIKAHEILVQDNESNVAKWEKYPLVLLLRPYKEDNNSEEAVYANLSIAFVNITQQEWNADQRYANNITPILEPIFDAFLQAIVDNVNIAVWDIDKIKFDRQDDCLIDGNPLPDYLDGILVEFSKLPFKRKC